MNRQGLDFSDKAKIFFSGLFIGSERTFKGYSILFSIYTIGIVVAGTIINVLTNAHN